MQARAIRRKQGVLLRACPALELCFAPNRGFHRPEFLGIHQLHRKSSSGVGWTATSMVALEAFSHVGGATNVVGAITAAKDVDEVGHRMVPFDLLPDD